MSSSKNSSDAFKKKSQNIVFICFTFYGGVHAESTYCVA